MLEFDFSQFRKAANTLRQLQYAKYIPRALRKYAPYIRGRTFDRYLKAAKQTPYAQSTQGTKKRASGTIRGGVDDPGFGIDSGRVLSDLTDRANTLAVAGNTLSIWSDAEYAGYLHLLYEQKGPFAPEGVLFMDDRDWDVLEGHLGQELDVEVNW